MLDVLAALLLGASLLSGKPLGQAWASIPAPHPASATEVLNAAIRAGNVSEAEALIGRGADVNARDDVGNTPLFYAAWSGNSRLTELLIAAGAQVNAAQSSGRRAITWAVLGGKTEVVRLLLASGAEANEQDAEGHTLLETAARYGYREIAGLLLAAHVDVNATGSAGETALDEAVLAVQSDVVRMLLLSGADVRRVRPENSRGLVHEAAIKGSAALIDLLVEAGANPAARDQSGQSPLDLALAYQNRGAIAALEQLARERKDCAEAAQSAMERATRRGLTELVRLLLDGGFDAGEHTVGGGTYLHEAALKGQPAVVELLLERGADANARDALGSTPLHSAALAGSTEAIGALLERGAAIDAVEEESGATPLMLAAALARTKAVAVLLRRGASAGLRDRAGRTALDRARQTDNRETVELLEEWSARSPESTKRHG